MSTCGACDRTRFERYAMSLKRYLATSTREAMAQVRRELGDDAVILSSKRVAGDRIEIVAAAPRAMESLVEETRTSRAAVMQTLAASRARAAAMAGAHPPIPAAPRAGAKPAVDASAPLAGESFQQFVRRQSAAPAVNASRAPARAAVTTTSAVPATRTRNSVAMYSDVAATPEAAADDDIWKPTTFHLPAERGESWIAPTPSATAARAPSRLAAPAHANVHGSAAASKHGSMTATANAPRVAQSPYPVDAAVAAELQRQAETRQRAADRALRASFAAEPVAPARAAPRGPNNDANRGPQDEGYEAQALARGALAAVDPAVFRRRPVHLNDAAMSVLPAVDERVVPHGSASLPLQQRAAGLAAPLFAASAGDMNSRAAAKPIAAPPAAQATVGASLPLSAALPLAPSSSAPSSSAPSSSAAATGVTTGAIRVTVDAQRVAPAQEATRVPLAATAAPIDSASNADRALMAEIQKLRAALQAQIAALSQT